MQYDYRCPDCNAEMTIERKITDEARPPSCFDCHIEMVRKFDAPSIQFKGTGWGHQ